MGRGVGGGYDNPSRWSRRLPILILSLAGLCVATYLALYQWGLFHTVWEPFFGDGSRRILHSAVSRLLPVPDASLGALGYLADIVTDSLGGEARWRTAPWAVLLFGLVVCGMGLGSLALLLLQPLAFHALCTLCLTSAGISILILILAVEEIRATLQHLRHVMAERVGLWQALRTGGR